MGKKPQGALATVSSDDGYVDPKKIYDDWSETYDRDLLDEYGYKHPDLLWTLFKEFCRINRPALSIWGAAPGWREPNCGGAAMAGLMVRTSRLECW